jgi:hypothetical protein
MRKRFVMIAIGLLFGCRPAADIDVANEATPEPSRDSAPSTASPDPGTPGALPDDRTPLAEPKGPIDPKSAEGAGQVMQHYGVLLEQRRFEDAYDLLDHEALDWKWLEFKGEFASYREIHAGVGKPGKLEGAAGSVYVTVPFQLYGKLQSGGDFAEAGTATLRRVNDVPGSTREQRQWHIVKFDMRDTK